MRKFAILFLCVCFLFSGCAKKEEKQAENSMPKEPEVLSSLEESILTLMAKVDMMPSMNKALEEKKKDEAIVQQKELLLADVSNDRLSEKDRSKPPEEKEMKQIKISDFTQDTILYDILKSENIKDINELEKGEIPSKLEESWMDVKKDLIKIHKSWNELEAKMVDVPVEKEAMDNFENNLNLLTSSIDSYDIFNSLVYANNMSKYTADFKTYFKSPTNNDIDKMKYSIRKVVLLAQMKEFEEAIKSLDTTVQMVPMKGDKMYSKDKEIYLKLKYSLEDLKKSIENKDLKLMAIKAPIVIENINETENIKE